MKKVLRRLKTIYKRLKNIKRWMGVIYRDHDWDHYYIYEILKTKLKFQAEFFKNHGYKESSEKNANTMMRCVELINIVQNEKYIDDFLKHDHWDNEKAELAQKRHDNARKELFTLIEQNIELWWD